MGYKVVFAANIGNICNKTKAVDRPSQVITNRAASIRACLGIQPLHGAAALLAVFSPCKQSPPLATAVQVQPLQALHGDLQHGKMRLGNGQFMPLWLASFDLRWQATGGFRADRSWLRPQVAA
jgi:hypothetical protein